MLNAVNLALATFARFHANLEGHVFLIMVMAIAAVEVGVGLAIVILLFRNKGTIDSADFKIMKF
jgi:NADH-quinone oxidoreductase subunit K